MGIISDMSDSRFFHVQNGSKDGGTSTRLTVHAKNETHPYDTKAFESPTQKLK